MKPPVLDCIKKCPKEDIAVYASKIPELCRNDIFPDVTGLPSGTETVTGTATGTVTQTNGPENTGTGGAGVLGFEVSRVGILMGGLVAVGAAML